MNTRSIALASALGILVVGWLVVSLWPGGSNVLVEVKQNTPRTDRFATADIIFGFGRELELTELVVERLDEATEVRAGMIITESDGPGPVWRLLPRDEREASDKVRVIHFGRPGRIGMRVDLATAGLDPGIRYRVVVRAKGGLRGEAEFVAEPNPRREAAG